MVKSFLDSLILFFSSVVSKNVRLMKSNKSGGMMHLLQSESFGGNADKYKGFPCAGANFVFDRETGLIIEFTNKSRDSLKHGGLALGIFRIAILWDISIIEDSYYKIIETNWRGYDVSDIAKANLEKSIALYNKMSKEKRI